jgi:hypothetical protein
MLLKLMIKFVCNFCCEGCFDALERRMFMLNIRIRSRNLKFQLQGKLKCNFSCYNLMW